jgi:hypothetical protein
MTVVAFNSEVQGPQLKKYADVICFSQVGVPTSEISSRLELPEHLVSAWIDGWVKIERAMSA